MHDGSTLTTVGAYDPVRTPNAALRVVVYHLPGTTARVTATGTAALAEGQVDQAVVPAPTTGSGNESASAFSQTIVTIPARAPGTTFTVDISISGQSVGTLEFIVDTRYRGAIRVGIGMLTGRAVDRSYGTEAIDGAAQSEIVLLDDSPVEFELVVGYAPFLERWGRSYTLGRFSPQFAPYVGLSLVGQNAAGDLTALQSLYFGGEVELGKSFSIAATLAISRTERLRDAYAVGSAVDGSPPTVRSYRPAFGLVINLTPEFLRFTGLSSGLGQRGGP